MRWVRQNRSGVTDIQLNFLLLQLLQYYFNILERSVPFHYLENIKVKVSRNQ